MRIGHASISEKGTNGRSGAVPGDQTGKEVCIRSYYSKPWQTLLRCTDPAKREIMATACEWLCNSNLVGYNQAKRLTLHQELQKLNYNYRNLRTKCETDCSAFMTCLCEIAGIFPAYASGNAPVTANMVNKFKATGMFEVITTDVNNQAKLLRGDILVGPPNTHTVMVLDNGTTPQQVQTRRTLKKGMKGDDVKLIQTILIKERYDCGKWGADGDFGSSTESALKQFQLEKGLVPDGICGKKTWAMLEQYN